MYSGRECKTSTLQDGQSVRRLPWKRWALARSALVKTENGKMNRPVVKLSPLFYETVFLTKNRVDDVGARPEQTKKVNTNNSRETWHTYAST